MRVDVGVFIRASHDFYIHIYSVSIVYTALHAMYERETLRAQVVLSLQCFARSDDLLSIDTRVRAYATAYI